MSLSIIIEKEKYQNLLKKLDHVKEAELYLIKLLSNISKQLQDKQLELKLTQLELQAQKDLNSKLNNYLVTEKD